MRLIALAMIATLLVVPARADEVTDTIEAALEAYRAGDYKLAKEELDFAAQLVGQLKANDLLNFLPDPMDGWAREDSDTQDASLFGAGLMAMAYYNRGDERIDITLMADSPMVAAMAAALGNAALMRSMGEVKRVNGQRLVITTEGEIQALIDGRVLVQIGGKASTEDKLSYFEALDLDGLAAF